MPMLPQDLREVLVGTELAEDCKKQFRLLDKEGKGKLGQDELVPVIVQLSATSSGSIAPDQVAKFMKAFDVNGDGAISIDEFTSLTQFVVIASHMESPEGQQLLQKAKLEENVFSEFISILQGDRNRINDIIPFLPDWFVDKLSGEEFIVDCHARFDELDKDKSGSLDPNEVLPVVISLCDANPDTVDRKRLMSFFQIFDVDNNGLIMRDEFIDFAQFLSVMNFLTNSMEGQQIYQASLDFTNQIELEKHIAMLKENWKNLPKVIHLLPESVVNDISSNGFANLCNENFKYLAAEQDSALDPIKLYPLANKLCSEHPIRFNEAIFKELFASFDKEGTGKISSKQVVDFARFVVVVAYLASCQEWHDTSVQNSKERINQLLAYLKTHVDKIDHVVTYLPREFQEDLLSKAFEQQCMEDFRSIDTDNSGFLEPKELIPLILNLSDGHHFAITSDHVLEFVGLFDTMRNGVITPVEFINLARCMMIFAYLETEEGAAIKQEAEVDDSLQRIAELLAMLKNDRNAIHKVIPLLPETIYNELVSDDFIVLCKQRFAELDKDGNGSLSPDELHTIICELSDAQPYAIDIEHCKEFTEIFDMDGDGVIRTDEFVDFARFLCVMNYLESDEAKKTMGEGLKIMESSKEIDELVATMSQSKREMQKVLPYLPDDLCSELLSAEFVSNCLAKFSELDEDVNGSLDPIELYPLILELTSSHEYSLDLDQCTQFMTIFDDEKTGVISKNEFVDFARFLMIMGFLRTDDGKKTLALAANDEALKVAADPAESGLVEYVDMLKKDPNSLKEVLWILPKAVVDDISSDVFAKQCIDTFNYFDRDNKKEVDPRKLFPMLNRFCVEHAIHMDDAFCQELFVYFDTEGKGVVSFEQVVECGQFIVALSYLICCSEWQDSSVKHSKARIEELLDYLTHNLNKLGDVLPYLPQELQKKLMSDDFERQCMADFQQLDKANSGVLEPKELIPLILILSEGQQLSLTYDHVMEFLGLFDTAKNGVLTPGEFMQFSRFMMILAYLETEDGRAAVESSEIEAGRKEIEDMLEMMKKDRNAIHKVIPLLPAEIFEDITSDDFVMRCHDAFGTLDSDKNGTLDPAELHPIIVQISEAHPYAIDLEHCKEFTAIFDLYGDGVIRKDEFVDFARFLCVMNFLRSDEGQEQMVEGMKILESSQEIDDLVSMLKNDRRQMRKVMPYLPDDLRDELLSELFTSTCLEKFKELDKDGNGSLDPSELYPIILEMTNAHHYALDLEQCNRFMEVFDDEKTGVISRKEFVNFARFLMVLSYLGTDDGKKTLAIATSKRAEQKQAKKELTGLPTQSTDIVARSAGNDGHLAVDLEFYQGRSEKLAAENDTLRSQMFRMEESMRRMESRMDEQDQRLRHADIDLRASGGKLR